MTFLVHYGKIWGGIMGNYRSGRWQNEWSEYKKRGCVDDALAISTTYFRQLRLTDQTVFSGFYHWDRVVGECELGFTISPNFDGGLQLSLGKIYLTDDQIAVDQEINMHSIPIPRGGHKWIMNCPLTKTCSGNYPIPCGAKCFVLYFDRGTKKFGCRKCLDLTYRSRQAHEKQEDPEAFKRAVVKAHKLFESSDEAKRLRDERLLHGIWQLPKGVGSSGGSSPAA